MSAHRGTRMKRSLFGIAAIAAMIGTPALAADMMPYKAPPPATPVWGWTGFYIGGDAGTFPRSNKLSTTGVLGGATAGFNYQFSSFLLGIEGDIGAMEIGGSKAD